MKKSHHFTELSDKVCNVEGCNRKIKERLVDGAPWTGKKEAHNIGKCFRCYNILALSEMRRSDIPSYKTDIKHINSLAFSLRKDFDKRVEKEKERKANKASS
jgi:hypothetical protein